MTTLISYGAMRRSLEAEEKAMDKSAHNPVDVATAVGMEAAERHLKEAARIAAEEGEAVSTKLKKASLLGCWVDGKLKFQSRDHDAVRGYAENKMNDKRVSSVWLAPVGSFHA